MQEAGSIRIHFFNPWNVVEATTLASLTVAMLFRMWAFVCDGNGAKFCGELAITGSSSSVSDLNEVYLAQYFQAASAPFVLGKVLFLTQVRKTTTTTDLPSVFLFVVVAVVVLRVESLVLPISIIAVQLD